MSSVARKDKVRTKKVIVSKAASFVKEWLRSDAPKGPCQSVLVVWSVDFQWGWWLGGSG